LEKTGQTKKYKLQRTEKRREKRKSGNPLKLELFALREDLGKIDTEKGD
jgi:hypothetical protein